MTATSSEPVGFLSAASDSADGFWRQTEKRRQSFHPLFQQLAAMHEDQRVDAALGDEPRSDHGLAEGGRGGQNAGVVGQHRPAAVTCSGRNSRERKLSAAYRQRSSRMAVSMSRSESSRSTLPDSRVADRCAVDGLRRSR